MELKTYPDPCLKIKTKIVENFDDDLKKTLKSMVDFMYTHQGIGLAATQVGLGISVFVMDIGEDLQIFVNPVITDKTPKKTYLEEGCLSLPGITVNVSRPEKITVRAQDPAGEFFIKNFEGLEAKAAQHEMDHLEGKLIINYLNPIKYFIVSRKLSNVKSKNEKTCEVVCETRK